MGQSGLWPMLYAIGKQLLAFHRIRICMYIMRRIGWLTRPTQSIHHREIYFTAYWPLFRVKCQSLHIGLILVLIFTLPAGGWILHFDADAKKTTDAVILTNETRADFPTRHTADSCYFWELGDVFVRPVRGLTPYIVWTRSVFISLPAHVYVEGRWISILFFFFIYIFIYIFWRLISYAWFKRIKFENVRGKILVFILLELNFIGGWLLLWMDLKEDGNFAPSIIWWSIIMIF